MQTLCVSIGHILDGHLRRHFLWPSPFHDVRYLRSTQLESLTLYGACTIKSMSTDTLANLGRLSESSISCLTTVRLERLGRRVSPKKFPSFPLLLAAFKTGLQKPTISSASQFVAFEPESVKSLLNVEELEFQYIHPGSWRHVAQFLDCRLKRLVVDICADQSD
ncbi:hypothetical protein ARMGADRAFT_1085019 [Armillaria gallica]|uniref:Uncharacterized protein n=1 Tax=Armillaria gallica TaxID=47427 RepID=A0A2H3DIH3_ARMGA|nr:hypothetical protein ARMGADRAFT_1085019 [Armillaria gallica]